MFLPNLAENLFLSLLLILIATAGDYLVGHVHSKIFTALSDNLTHAVIGGFSWFIVCFNCKRYNSGTLLEIFFCTLIASIIDIDHFLAARSFHLEDATNLHHRPILHCSTIPLVLIILLNILAVISRSQFLYIYSLLLFTAFSSHHTRDATRRGYWFCPFGSTQPISYQFYIILTVFIPYLVIGLLNFTSVGKTFKRYDFV